jgi:hypothetical protein
VASHENSTMPHISIMMRALVDIDPNTAAIVAESAQSWDLSDGLEILLIYGRD